MDPEIEARFRKERDLVGGHFEFLELKIDDFRVEVRATLQQHGAILERHGAILEEHSAILERHGAILEEHSAILKQHGAILQDHSGKLDDHTSRLERLDRRLDRIEVLLAGIDRRLIMAVQPRFDDHERRLGRLEGAG